MQTHQLHAQLLASVLTAGAPLHSARADLEAIIERTNAQLAALRLRKPYNMRAAAKLVERRRRCETAVVDMLSGG